MWDKTYKAYEIKEQKVRFTEVEGSLEKIAAYIKSCDTSSIVTIQTPEGEPFLIALSKVFLFCADTEFLDEQLIPLLYKTD